jgi:hypothetical protein
MRGWGAGSGPRQQLVALAYVPLTIERRDRRPRLEVHSTRASHDPGKGMTIPDARLLSRPGRHSVTFVCRGDKNAELAFDYPG